MDCLVAVRQSHAQIRPQHGAALVDVLRFLQVLVRLCEALLLQRDVAESPPGVIVRLVGLQRSLIALFTVLVVLVGNELVAAEGVRVGEVLVELDRASEELQCRLVLFQQAVAVANDAPSFRSEERFLYSLVTEEDKGRLVLQVPEAC